MGKKVVKKKDDPVNGIQKFKQLLKNYKSEGTKLPTPEGSGKHYVGFSFPVDEIENILTYLKSEPQAKIFFSLCYHSEDYTTSDSREILAGSYSLMASPLKKDEKAWYIPYTYNNQLQVSSNFEFCEPCPKLCPEVELEDNSRKCLLDFINED